MKTSEFLLKLGETLMVEEPLTRETRLDSLSGWDSMGMVAVFSLIDQSFGASLPRGSLQKCVTVDDIVHQVKAHLSD